MIIVLSDASCKCDPSQWKCSEQAQKYVRPVGYILVGFSFLVLAWIIFLIIDDHIKYGRKKNKLSN